MYERFLDFFGNHPSLMNSTHPPSPCPSFVSGETVCLPPLRSPFYFAPRQSLFDGIPDTYLALAAPVLAYWILSLLFHCLDISGWRWLDKYRIHDSEEIKSKNLATPREVVWAVILQHIIQTILGLAFLSNSSEISLARSQSEMEDVGQTLVWVARHLAGERGLELLELCGPELTHWLYWWGIPAAQILFALFIVDTWQYFLHRLMHTNKFLYRNIHSVHHRLYVPYAFGALYNHPVEGFLLDSLGAIIAESLAHLTIRQTMFVFAFSTCKTVDDHCGYSLPFDPFQMISGNNADYHDIHHQTIGIKSNFAQPFFVHWDALLGTRMTRKDIQERKQKFKST